MDIYLYDRLSSGAGYTAGIKSSIGELLRKTKDLLSGCTCDCSCYKCLRNYYNSLYRGSLDRKAALELLEWGGNGKLAPEIPDADQRSMLELFKPILESYDVEIDLDRMPIEAKKGRKVKRVVVYSSMWAKNSDDDTVFVSDLELKYAKPYALHKLRL